MITFLEDLASELFVEHGNQISHLTVVFPSHRAERYFILALQKLGCSKKPKFATIDELMQRFSTIKIADNLSLIGKLYNVYGQYHTGESFDKFYSFGKLLLSDFDAIDKYMVDAKKLYSIVNDTLDIENRFKDSLHDKAFEFWRNFQKSKAEFHKNQYFIHIWSSLYEIYSKYRSQLASENIGYQGMIYRDVAQNIDQTKIDGKFIFAGLNALTKSEKQVLKHLDKNDQAQFYWDYDIAWLEHKNHEASYFILSNIDEFKNNKELSNKRTKSTEIEIITTPTDILQCKIAGRVLETLYMEGSVSLSQNESTAIVLTDENLLMPLLHSLPDNKQDINISIGYPIDSTLSFKYLNSLIELQETKNRNLFYYKDVFTILAHPFIEEKDLITELKASEKFYFSPEDINSENQHTKNLFEQIGKHYYSLHNYLFKAINELSTCAKNIDEKELYAVKIIADRMKELISTIQSCGIEITSRIYTTLLKESIKSEKIPFKGLSGKGVQVMGILETRALDFDNVIILSMNDDNFPSAKTPSSYVPQNLRIAYGLPTTKEHSAIWSYYFYRLLNRAKKVSMIYCNTPNSTTSGEASRYIHQLKYNYKYQIKDINTIYNITNENAIDQISIPKTAKHVSELRQRAFSPSAINRYINCPLSFYFSDIEALKPDNQIQNQEITNLDVGTILHQVMYDLYTTHKSQSAIAGITHQEITSTIKKVVNEVLNSKTDTTSPSIALAELALERMVENILYYDINISPPFDVIAIEKSIKMQIEDLIIKGTVDRIDRMHDGTIRVIDYKSGGEKANFTSIDTLFKGSQKEHNHAIAQLLTYSVLVNHTYNAPISAALYMARKMGAKQSVDPTLVCAGNRLELLTQENIEDIQVNIKSILGEITDSDQPFSQSSNKPESCVYCPYKPICQV